MTRDQFVKMHEEFCSKARQITQQKNHDYCGPQSASFESDPYAIFRNFLRCEQLGICSVEAGFLTRLTDKFARLCTLANPDIKAQVKDESFNDTVIDMINYLLLLSAYRMTKEEVSCKSK
jgi:hypothetical protein